jgi:hypothetical protein
VLRLRQWLNFWEYLTYVFVTFIDYSDANLIWQVPVALGLSYRSVKGLNDFIDHRLPGRPPFYCKVLDIGHERLEFYYRDALECIRSLFGDPQYAQDLVFAPERHYTDHERKTRVYHEMYTCDWWWSIQVRNLLMV